jgi:hypothetical protein
MVSVSPDVDREGRPDRPKGRRLMARRRSLSSKLYRAARLSNNISALASGNPRRVARRAKNVLVGRALGRAGVWRRLWR